MRTKCRNPLRGTAVALSVTARHDVQRSQVCTKTGLVYPWRCPHVKRRMNKHKWHRQSDTSGETVDRWSLGRETSWLRNGRRRPSHVRRRSQGRRDGRAGWWGECPSWEIGFPVSRQRGDPTGPAYLQSPAVQWELDVDDPLRLALGRAFSLFDRLRVMDHSSSRPPVPASFSDSVPHWKERDRSVSVICSLCVYSYNLPYSTSRLWDLTRWRHDHSSTDRPAATRMDVPPVHSAIVLTSPSCITSLPAPPTVLLEQLVDTLAASLGLMQLHDETGLLFLWMTQIRRSASRPTFSFLMDIFEQLSSSSWWYDATAYVLPRSIDCHPPQIWNFYFDKVLYLLVDTSFFHFFVVFQLFSFVIMLNVRWETGVNLTFRHVSPVNWTGSSHVFSSSFTRSIFMRISLLTAYEGGIIVIVCVLFVDDYTVLSRARFVFITSTLTEASITCRWRLFIVDVEVFFLKSSIDSDVFF